MVEGGITVVLSFIGTLIALLLTKTVERVYTQRLQRAEMSRDMLMYLADTLVAIERFIGPLASSDIISDAQGLRKIPSSYTWGRLPVKSEVILSAFSVADFMARRSRR